MKKLFGLSAGFALFLGLLFSFMRLPVVPCVTFAADSDRGYYPSLCPLFDEDGRFFLSSGSGTYDSRPWAWTWAGLVFVFIALPFLAAMLVRRLARKAGTRTKTASGHDGASRTP